MNERIALITGATGQDGAYLAGFLLDKGYRVYGSPLLDTGRVEPIYQDPHQKNLRFVRRVM